jgi:hypothetical protein
LQAGIWCPFAFAFGALITRLPGLVGAQYLWVTLVYLYTSTMAVVSRAYRGSAARMHDRLLGRDWFLGQRSRRDVRDAQPQVLDVVDSLVKECRDVIVVEGVHHVLA